MGSSNQLVIQGGPLLVINGVKRGPYKWPKIDGLSGFITLLPHVYLERAHLVHIIDAATPLLVSSGK